MPFFSDFSRKNRLSHVHILSRKHHSRKNTLLSSPYFIKKRPVSQKHCGAMLFLQNFQEKIPAVKLIFGQKDINSVKTKLYYGPK